MPPRRRAAPSGASAISLSDVDGVRYLHFGTEWIQGAMRVSRPFELVLDYTREMMVWLLFVEPARAGFHIGQLGLGAAALTKFCLAHFAPARVTAVDLDPAVIRCAQEHFGLVDADPRLSLVAADAGAFVAGCGPAFDVLQVDLYDAAARGPVHGTDEFYRACRGALRAGGLTVVNLFGARARLRGNIAALRRAFDGRLLVLPETDTGNRVALGFTGPEVVVSAAALHARVVELEERCGLRGRRWISGLRRAVDEAGLEVAGRELRI